MGIAVPLVWFFFQFHFDRQRLPAIWWVLYVFVLNTIILIAIGGYATSSFAYPFSNSLVRKDNLRSQNKRYGLEFRRTVERITRMIKDMVERQNSDRASEIMNDRMNYDDDSLIDRESTSSSYQFLSARDIYMRVA